MVSHFINDGMLLVIDNLRFRWPEMKKIREKDVTCLILVSRALVHDDGPEELHAIKRNVKILRDGLNDYLFEAPMAEDHQEDPGGEMLPIEV